MELSHTPGQYAARFDDPGLVSCAGLVPGMALAESVGLAGLVDTWLELPTSVGANGGAKVTSLVAGMLAGADSIEDMGLLRHGATGVLFTGAYAPSTLGSFLRGFSHGHLTQLTAATERFLGALGTRVPLLPARCGDGPEPLVLVDIDDTIIEVYGYQKQAASYGYTGVRGLNAIIATVSTSSTAPVIVGQRLRRGKIGSAWGAARFVTDALRAVRGLDGSGRRPLLRADSAYYGRGAVGAALRAGADVSVTVRLRPNVIAAIAGIEAGAWIPIQATSEPGSVSGPVAVAEVPFTAFVNTPAESVRGRLVVRRVPALNPDARQGQGALFDVWRYHAFFTTSELDVVTADRVHRQHAIIEAVNADLKDSALAHLPSGKYAANAAWLTLAAVAFNLSRAVGLLAGGAWGRARSGTIRRRLINVAARITRGAGRYTLRLPARWPWQGAWERLFTHAWAPSPARDHP